MGQIADLNNPWRQILLSVPASFRGVVFHVENGTRLSGRRTVVHEYPKRNEPYSEDMGRHARRFQFSGYLIYRPNNPLYQYTIQRVRLLKALEDDDSGPLIHPVFTLGETIQAVVERYSMTESRERGGFTQFDMSFVEAGSPGNSIPLTDTNGNVVSRAENAEQQSLADLKRSAKEVV